MIIFFLCLFYILLDRRYVNVYALQHPPTIAAKPRAVRGLPIHQVPLRQQQQKQQQSSSLPLQAPYCYALSSITDLPPQCNFLASQVWPSARVAAKILEERFLAGDLFPSIRKNENCNPGSMNRNKFTICELGCGPGLPSLVFAATATRDTTKTEVKVNVIATDIDEFALELVNAAAIEQGLENIISTRSYDLSCGDDDESWMDDVDLFVMSDVFESNAVAVGAARLTHRIFSRNSTNNQTSPLHANDKKFFVFSQTDRVQRDIYVRELRRLFLQSREEGHPDVFISSSSSFDWSTPESYNPVDFLWLCEVDETRVDYG
mmetsp:Transcript_42050/g.48608  ORF Transcript_42050/g.48608 Transcript_42050/m.48608 type:complete len:319 (-) Transcript_42050:66-1022(-)